ncbi:type I-C CRISPR-associated protein Cas8c/Csd1 [Pelagicoccus sp. NFK12]|uniref:Type I-C CRISPR-associated protein Cas8c/Csd1 n=1 Tax=Pelagicoccus enzymogenes TaxID=2773457 RepID=A0A927F6B1_9BACT|nr:type I-C CRISPR-associated protein Cas8c/Csd1 [Pelagicoccus enzymogenes]MBD5779017.1 type I-C CRISPR-associated protein Cas8c/Csd1 [Pelagicoccus enzymogenes]
MILQSLNELYDRLAEDKAYAISPPGFSPQKISFKIVIRLDGSFIPPQDARSPNDKGKLQNTLVEVPGGAKPSGAGVNPCFLWDNQTYLLGRQPEDKKSGFGIERFEAFRERHLALEKEIDCPEFSAVCRFLESWDPVNVETYPILNELGTGFGVFQIQGQKGYVHETPKIRNWWIKNQPREVSASRGQCLISGERDVEIARLHPKIKGVVGAQSAGASIVSFNDAAYESYAKTQSFNSPVSEDVAFRYGTALNALLTGPKSRDHRIRIGDTTCVFWTERQSAFEDVFADILGSGSHATDEVQDETQRERIERCLKAIQSGRGFVDDKAPVETPFYLLGLAPNAARLSVRFFLRSTIEELLKKLNAHLEDMKIVRQFENQTTKGRKPDPEFPAVWQLLNQSARVSDEVPPLLGGALTRAIVEGTRYPEALYGAVLRRIRADRTINYLRVAIVKATLVRNHQYEIPTMLDKSETTPAYLLGRLFSALEKTQEDALSGLNATIRDRFYSAASATPASVFPRLLRTYQHHLSKLNPGGKVVREKLVQEIIDPLESSGFPSQLNIKAQGLFAIGYYHQRKAFFTSKTENDES